MNRKQSSVEANFASDHAEHVAMCFSMFFSLISRVGGLCLMAHGFRRRWMLKRDADAKDLDGPDADDERVRSRSLSFSIACEHKAFDN